MKMKQGLSWLALAVGMGLAPLPALAQDELVVTFGEDSSSDALYDPRVSQSRHEGQVIVQIFETLIADDGTGTMYPGLAKSWEVSEDSTSIHLVLREDVTFHDGTPFNAEAVKFTFDSIVDPALGSQGAIDVLGPYEGTEVLGEYEVVVNFSRPYPAVLSALSDFDLAIVSPTAVQEMGNTGFAQHPVGTGPFKFVEWQKGTQVVLERYEDYAWAPEFYDNEGPSQVSKIIHRFIPNAGTRVAALEAGEITISDLTPPLDMRRLGDADGYEVMPGVVAGVPFSMMFNISHGELSDIDFRKAMIMSVDRSKLAMNLFFGYANPAYGPLSSTTPAYWDGVEEYYPYDPDAAAALLDGAGWTMGDDGYRYKDGEKASIHYLSMLEPEASVALQAELKKQGIELQIDSVTKARQDELIMANEYEMGAIRWVSTDPSVLRIPFHSENIPGPGKFKFNWMHADAPELDKMIGDAAAATSTEEQESIYADLQKYIMDEAIFWPLHDQVQTIVYSDEIEGLKYSPGQWQVRLYDVRPAE